MLGLKEDTADTYFHAYRSKCAHTNILSACRSRHVSVETNCACAGSCVCVCVCVCVCACVFVCVCVRVCVCVCVFCVWSRAAGCSRRMCVLERVCAFSRVCVCMCECVFWWRADSLVNTRQQCTFSNAFQQFCGLALVLSLRCRGRYSMALMRCDTYDDEQHMMMRCPPHCNPSLLREGGGWKGGGADTFVCKNFLAPSPSLV